MAEDAQKTILLVEDEAVIAVAEAKMLKRNGYAVYTAYSGSSAIETASRMPEIDLVLMDLDLGRGMDGTETAERILDAKNLPVLFLSSHTEPEVVERTERVTSYGYVVKNSGETVLMASIKMAFKLFDARIQIQRKNAELQAVNARLGDLIEEQRRVEKALRESEAEFRSLFEAAPAGVAMLRSREFVKVNARMCETFGYSEAEMLGRTTRLLYVDDEEFARVGKVLYGGLRGKRREVIETRLLRKDGSAIDVLIGASAMDPLAADPMESVAAVFFDISERKRAEDSLRSKERTLADVFRTCPEFISLSTVDGDRILEVNQASLRLFGYTREEMVGRGVDELGLWNSPEERAELVERLGRDRLIQGHETKFRKKDGTAIDVRISMASIEVDGRACVISFVAGIA